MVFCDGHARFVSEEMPYWIYVQLMTPDGKRAVINPQRKIPAPAAFRQPLPEEY